MHQRLRRRLYNITLRLWRRHLDLHQKTQEQGQEMTRREPRLAMHSIYCFYSPVYHKTLTIET